MRKQTPIRPAAAPQLLLLGLSLLFSSVVRGPAEPLTFGNLVFNCQDNMVLQLDPATGAISTNSAISSSLQVEAFAFAPNGDLVIMYNTGAYPWHPDFSRINPTTGQQQALPYSGLMDNERGMDLTADGKLVVSGHAGGYYGLFTVNPADGQQTLLATNNHPLSAALAVAPTGKIYVCDGWYPTSLLCFDPDGSNRRTLCTLGNMVQGTQVGGLAVGPSGDIFAALTVMNSVVRVDPNTGAQVVVSSGGNLVLPMGIAVSPIGDIFVSNLGSPRKILKIDPTTGAQAVVATPQYSAVLLRYANHAPPKLGLRLANGVATLAWPKAATNYCLEAAPAASAGSAWLPVGNSATDTAWERQVTLDTSLGCRFFRLRKGP